MDSLGAVCLHCTLSSFSSDLETKLYLRLFFQKAMELCAFSSVLLFSSSSYLANEAVWLVLEYMDGGSLAMVILMKTMAVGHIATVCQEVRNPSACAWHGLDRHDL